MTGDGLVEWLGARVEAVVSPAEPGVAVALWRDGQQPVTVVAGRAHLEHPAQVVADTVFAVGSVSKQFTAACLLLLERDGLLGLDDPVATHLPGLRLREPVTVRQCLHHTAGLREYYTVARLLNAAAVLRDNDAVLRLAEAAVDTDFAPGSEHCYSNTGYVLAAAVVTAVTGRSLSQVATERIFAPLGMVRTSFRDDPTVPVPGRAAGYRRSPHGWAQADDTGAVVGDGGLLSTVVDLARWHQFLLHGHVLGTDIRDDLLRRAVLTNGRIIDYALGIHHRRVHQHMTVGHGGSVDGFRAQLLHLPTLGLGMAVLANRDDLDTTGLAADLLAITEQPPPATMIDPVVTSGTGVPGVPVAADDTQPLTGFWFEAGRRQVLRLTGDDAQPVLHLWGLRIPLRSTGPGAWTSRDGEVQVQHSADGMNAMVLDGEHRETWHLHRARVHTDTDTDTLPVGTYHSLELGTLARIDATDDILHLQMGAGPRLRLLPALTDIYHSALVTVFVDRDTTGRASALRLTGRRVRDLHFTRINDHTALGYPVVFGGPRPSLHPGGPQH